MKVLLFGLIAEKANASELLVTAASTHALKRSLEVRIPSGVSSATMLPLASR